MLAVGYPNLDGKEWIYWMLQLTLVSLLFCVYFLYCKIQKSLPWTSVFLWEACKLKGEDCKSLLVTAVSALAVTGDTQQNWSSHWSLCSFIADVTKLLHFPKTCITHICKFLKLLLSECPTLLSKYCLNITNATVWELMLLWDLRIVQPASADIPVLSLPGLMELC